MTKIAIKDCWTDPGTAGYENEDGWGQAACGDISALWIVDGCTDLDRDRSVRIYPGGTSNAFWYKQSLLQHLEANFSALAFDDPKAFLSQTVDLIRRDYEAAGLGYDKEDWAFPSSTFTAAVLNRPKNLLRMIWIGDSSCGVRKTDGAIEFYPPPRKTLLNQKSVLLTDCMREYRESRARHIQDGDVSLSLFPERLPGLHSLTLDALDCRELLLGTDGFYRLMTDFDYSPAALFDLAAQDLSMAGKKLRALESDLGASMAMRHAKPHDDATAVFARLSL